MDRMTIRETKITVDFVFIFPFLRLIDFAARRLISVSFQPGEFPFLNVICEPKQLIAATHLLYSEPR